MLTLRQPDLDAIAELAAPGARAVLAAFGRAAEAFHVNAPMDPVIWIMGNGIEGDGIEGDEHEHGHIELPPSMTDRPGLFRLDPIQQALVREATESHVRRGALGQVPRMNLLPIAAVDPTKSFVEELSLPQSGRLSDPQGGHGWLAENELWN